MDPKAPAQHSPGPVTNFDHVAERPPFRRASHPFAPNPGMSAQDGAGRASRSNDDACLRHARLVAYSVRDAPFSGNGNVGHVRARGRARAREHAAQPRRVFGRPRFARPEKPDDVPRDAASDTVGGGRAMHVPRLTTRSPMRAIPRPVALGLSLGSTG